MTRLDARRSAIVLAVVGGLAHLVESALIAAGRAAWPGGSRAAAGAAIVAAIGIVGASAALTARRRSGAWAAVIAAGVVSVVFDFGAPSLALRAIPGVLMLASGALGTVQAATTAGEPVREGIWRWVARACLSIHALLLVPLLTFGLVVPMGAVLLLVALWAGGLHVALHAVREHPRWVPAVPAVFVITAVGLVRAGDALFGWGP